MFRTFHTLLLAAGFCLAPAPRLRAQQAVQLLFRPVMGRQALVPETRWYPLGGDSVQISTLRFYISGISLYRGHQRVWQEPDSYHLIDAAEPDRLRVPLSLPAGLVYDRLRFNLGIDSATNAGGARGGDLDATRGMYWAWQSGYINLKLEGVHPRCPARKHAFQYHLGGFGPGQDCLQQRTLAVAPAAVITVYTDAAPLLQAADPVQTPAVMIPGAEAVELSRKAAMMFYTQPPL